MEIQKDTPVKMIPVKTKDGVHIKEKISLFRMREDYQSADEYVVEEFKVIHVSNSTRRFRVVSLLNGMEDSLSMESSKSCGFFGKKKNAYRDIARTIKEDIQDKEQDINKDTKKLKKLVASFNRVMKKAGK